MKITNGAELVRKLRESGTPGHLLAPARALLASVHDDHGRLATSDEVLATLTAELGDEHGTVVKAHQIAETGDWKRPEPKTEDEIEEKLLNAKKPQPATTAK